MTQADDVRHRIALAIVGFEARYDSKHRIVVYQLPDGDGGGTYEVAGINDKYHPHEAADLAALVRAGKQKDVEERATEYIATYTDCAYLWTLNRGIEAYLRDCVFNRGARGAARIFQRAVGAETDGIVGPKTRLQANKIRNAADMLTRLSPAREWYERTYAHRDESSTFWKGLVNRWAKAAALADRFIRLERIGA